MTSARLAGIAILVAAAPAAALAHGGTYVPPGPSGPGGPQVPPGTADPPAEVTRWETWWAANKEYYLRLGEQMRVEDGPESRGMGAGRPEKPAVSEQDRRLQR